MLTLDTIHRYNFQIATGDSDSTDCSMKSVMKMGAAPETKCGPYSVSAMKPHDGGLIFLIDQPTKGLSGTFTAYPKDLKSVKSDDGERMSYKDGASFDVAAKAVLKVADGDDETPSTTGAPKVSSIASHAAMDPPSATTSAKLSAISSVGGGGGPIAGTTKVASADSSAVPTGSLKIASSAAPTAASDGSAMATATATDSSSSSSSTSASDESSSSSSSSDSDSSSSSSSSDESSGAARQSAFAGVMAAVGLMAFAF